MRQKFYLTVAVLALTAGIGRAQSLTLADCINASLQNNPTMRIARENIDKSKASIDEATALGMPKLNIQGVYTRVDKVPVADFNGNSIELGTQDSKAADLILTQPIDVFSIVKTGRRVAKLSKSSAQYDLDQATNDVTLDTKTAFFNVLRAQEFQKVQEDAVSQLEAHLKDAQLHYEAGTIARFDVLRAETELANAKQGLIAGRNGVQLAKSALNNVMGQPVATLIDVVEPEKPVFPKIELAACTDAACNWRPEVLKSKTQVRMADQTRKITSLAGKPRFNLQWDYNRNFNSTIFNPRDHGWTAYLTTNISVFDGGATRAAVDRASSDADNARSMQQQVTQGVTLDAQQAYLNLNESRDRIQVAEKGLEQAKEAMRLAQVRYQGGVSTQLEVLDAQAALTLAETNHVNATYDYQTALANLERAVGGKEQFAGLLAKATGGQ
jgi:outer membrane protein